MNTQLHEELKGAIWEIANRLRGPYRPPQYRLVMLPLVVLRRLDCVLAPTKDKVLKEYAKLQARGVPEEAMVRLLSRAALLGTSGFGSTVPENGNLDTLGLTTRRRRYVARHTITR